MVIDIRTRQPWQPPRPRSKPPRAPSLRTQIGDLIRIADQLADHARAMRTIVAKCRKRIG